MNIAENRNICIRCVWQTQCPAGQDEFTIDDDTGIIVRCDRFVQENRKEDN